MEETSETNTLRLRKEDAVRQIIAGQRTGQQVAEVFGISRQAVSMWVQRYKKNGDLVPGKRGRKKLHPFSDSERLRFFGHVLGLYEKKGYHLGDEVPGRDVVMESELQDALKQISGMPSSASRTMSLMRELGLPPYNSIRIIDGFYDDPDEWAEDMFPLRDPLSRPPPGERPAPATPAGDHSGDPDEPIPKTQEEYAEWLKETHSILKSRGINYDPEKMRVEAPTTGPGVRVGKHAKGSRHTPPKRRKKRVKKRR